MKDDDAASRATPANHDLVDEARTYVERMRNDQIKDLGCADSYEFGLIGSLANEVERLEKVARFNTGEAVNDRELFVRFMAGVSIREMDNEYPGGEGNVEIRLRAFVNGMTYASDMKGESDDD